MSWYRRRPEVEVLFAFAASCLHCWKNAIKKIEVKGVCYSIHENLPNIGVHTKIYTILESYPSKKVWGHLLLRATESTHIFSPTVNNLLAFTSDNFMEIIYMPGKTFPLFYLLT